MLSDERWRQLEQGNRRPLQPAMFGGRIHDDGVSTFTDAHDDGSSTKEVYDDDAHDDVSLMTLDEFRRTRKHRPSARHGGLDPDMAESATTTSKWSQRASSEDGGGSLPRSQLIRPAGGRAAIFHAATPAYTFMPGFDPTRLQNT